MTSPTSDVRKKIVDMIPTDVHEEETFGRKIQVSLEPWVTCQEPESVEEETSYSGELPLCVSIQILEEQSVRL